jgi:molybdopterin converting factor small subunit
MRVRVKLMGTLRSKTPPDGALEVPDAATITTVLEKLQIPPQQIHVVMVNGRPERDKNRPLAADDELTVLAPVGGG